MAEAVDSRWPGQLAAGLEQMGIVLDAAQQQRLLAYLALLYRWNRAFNLTAVRDPAIAVSRQLLDSLAILRFVQGPRVLDIGSGAGLPGIPLAIARPRWQVTLLDASGKKTRFLNQVKLELGLENVEVVNARVEEYLADRPFQTITSRAFAELGKMVSLSRHLLADRGRWVAMKGRLPRQELAALPADVSAEVVELEVPGEAAQRHAVLLEKADGGSR